MTVIFDPGREAPEGPVVPKADAVGAADGDIDQSLYAAFDIAESVFIGCAADLERIEKRLRKGEVDGCEEAVKAARALRGATQNLLEERNRVDKLRRQVAGVLDGAGSLDLDAARDEIGRRLACLRRAGDGR